MVDCFCAKYQGITGSVCYVPTISSTDHKYAPFSAFSNYLAALFRIKQTSKILIQFEPCGIIFYINGEDEGMVTEQWKPTHVVLTFDNDIDKINKLTNDFEYVKTRKCIEKSF